MAKNPNQTEIPVQPVERPVICNPYHEPSAYWYYDRETGEASKIDGRRPAGYWYKTDRTGTGQRSLFTEEERDDLTLVNRLREDVCGAGATRAIAAPRT